MKCVFCVPFLDRPTAPFLEALEGCLPAVEEAGWEHGLAQHMGNPYISNARADMLRKALDANADVIVFLDYDVSFTPEDMVKLLSINEPVVAGTYRFKNHLGEYMGGIWPDENGQAVLNVQGCIRADRAPAGFLKVTKQAVSTFAKAYPELLYGDIMKPHIDLFNHGAIDGIWYGEDYAFCKRWIDAGNTLWICPDLNIDHHSKDEVFKGNFHKYLMGDR
jgi:hypothetical protein